MYVTDGVANASFRVADTTENITLERAAELLQARRDRIAAGGGPKGGKKKAATKKTKSTAKKPPKKK